MKPPTLLITLVVLPTLLGNIAHAGSLRDWLAERKVEKLAAPGASPQEGEESSGQVTLAHGVRVLKDVAYGSNEAQKMDVYLPAHAVSAPVIFMVHGGAWRFGDKGASGVVQNKMARWVGRGFIFISTNYRMLPGTDPLSQAGDVARAMAFAQSNAAEWGGDPAKFILMGHSAGAHLVSLLSAAPAIAHAYGTRPWLGTVSLDSAAMDVVQVMQRKHYPLYDRAFGKDAAYWKSASPIHELSAMANPMLLVCSTIRADKPCAQAAEFAAKARAMGIRVEISEQAKSHREINEQLGEPGDYTAAVEKFMASLDTSVARLLAEPGR